MRAVVVYESMFGNTRQVAEAIGAGLRPGLDVDVVPVAQAGRDMLGGADLVVVGGPTHAHGMSRGTTRQGAADMAGKPGSGLGLEPGAGGAGPGLRDWLGELGEQRGRAAAFDTRVHGPAVLTGRAAKGVSRELRRHGFELVVEPESFVVTRDNRLEPGEDERARAWGAELARRVVPPARPAPEGA